VTSNGEDHALAAVSGIDLGCPASRRADRRRAQRRGAGGAIRAHPDGPLFLSLFRDPTSVVCAARLLAEIGDNRARYPHPDTLSADGGQAPVTKQSGKHRAVSFRWACDKRLRNHLAVLADSTRHWHRCWQDNHTYDPTQHRALTRHLAQQG
jgi:transposase